MKYKTLAEVQYHINNIENENKSLNVKLQDNIQILKELHKEEELLKYGKKPNCSDCRYSIVLDFSIDGWHNLCGNEDAPCTCCHDSCEYFMPHNEITEYIKKHSRHQLDEDDVNVCKILVGNIFDSDKWDTYTIDKTKRLFKCIATEKNDWKD